MLSCSKTRMIRTSIRFTHHRHSNSVAFPRSRELLTFFLPISSAFADSVRQCQARQSLHHHALYIQKKKLPTNARFPMSNHALTVMRNASWMMRIAGVALSPIHIHSSNMISRPLTLLLGLPDHPLPLHLLHVECGCINPLKLTIVS
jgi:hypothetical protein